jgi:hypothetical protein
MFDLIHNIFYGIQWKYSFDQTKVKAHYHSNRSINLKGHKNPF